MVFDFISGKTCMGTQPRTSCHLLAGLLGNQALAGAVVAVLGSVGDGVAHLGEAAPPKIMQ